MTSVLAMTACATTGGSESEETVCREIRAELWNMDPSATEADKIAYADLLDVFKSVCP